MNLRSPYSPPLAARKGAQLKQAAHFRHDHTHPQIHRNHRLVVAGGGVVVDGNDGGADAVAREFRTVAGNLLCRGRHWMGAAGDADHQLDGAARRLNPGGANVLSARNSTPQRITRMTRTELSRPSQTMRGSA